MLGYLSARAIANPDINYQKLGNCGVPKIRANTNIFEAAIGKVNDLTLNARKRRSPQYSIDEILDYGGLQVVSDQFGNYGGIPPVIDPTEAPNPATTAAPVVQTTKLQEQKVQAIDEYTGPTKRIVGGQAANENSWPWQAHLSVCGKWYGVLECNICGGSLIHPKWIVSAAHCVPDDPSGTIILGAHQISEGGKQMVPVKEFIKHTSWNRPKMFDNDLSLLLLNEDANISDFVSPICISHEKTCFSPQTPCVVTGWGLTSETGGFPDDLQEVAVRLITSDKCKTFQGYEPTITNNMLCAGFDGGDMDACAGDSGGPLVCPIPAGHGNGWVLYGVVSWGYGCARPNSPGVYTRMTNMGEFIKDTTGLIADEKLSWEDTEEGCGVWHTDFEKDFKESYEQTYSNATHVWGVDLASIQWTHDHNDDIVTDNSHLMTEQCNYMKTSDYAMQVFDSDHFEDLPEFILRTEGYPDRYPDNQDCTWQVKNTNPERFITVTVPKGIKMDCKDRIWIKRQNGKEINICRTKKTITLIDPSMVEIRFTSNNIKTAKGWQIFITFKKLTFMCEGSDNFQLTTTSKNNAQQTFLRSENYPRPYSAYSQCRWHITAEPGMTIGFFIKAFKTERSTGRCSSDHDNFLVFESQDCETDTLRSAPVWGSICGVKPNNRLRYNTGMKSICVTFLADGDNRRGKGFLVQASLLDSNNQVVPSTQVDIEP